MTNTTVGRRIVAGFALICSAILLDSAHAQTNPASPAVTLTQAVEPSFRIEPIVHRFKARRGQVIPFSFEIASTGKLMNAIVQPVTLRQEESGIIIHDPTSAPEDVLRFSTPLQFQLSPGESHVIRGEIEVPTAKSNYLSFGVLVKDEGQKFNPDSSSNQTDTTTQASVRFVTQYLLRIDIETEEVGSRELAHLQFVDGGFRSIHGFPVAVVYVENPTDYAFEFWGRARFQTSSSAGDVKPFFLTMPSRSSMEGHERHLIRMMPQSRLRLEAPINSPIPSGEHTLHVGASNGRREIVSADFDVAIDRDDFPALQTQFAYIGRDVSVSPAYIELGQIKKTSRTVALKFVNTADEPRTVELAVESLAGEAFPELYLSTRSLTIQPGRTKYVRALMRPNKKRTSPQFGRVRLSLADSEPTSTRLPAALFYGPPSDPAMSYSPVELVSDEGNPAFRILATNGSEGFVPLSATLQMTDENNRTVEMSAGYGKWLNSGEVAELRFVPTNPPSPGNYKLEFVSQTYPQHPPFTRTIVVTLNPVDASATAAVSPRPPIGP